MRLVVGTGSGLCARIRRHRALELIKGTVSSAVMELS